MDGDEKTGASFRSRSSSSAPHVPFPRMMPLSLRVKRQCSRHWMLVYPRESDRERDNTTDKANQRKDETMRRVPTSKHNKPFAQIWSHSWHRRAHPHVGVAWVFSWPMKNMRMVVTANQSCNKPRVVPYGNTETSPSWGRTAQCWATRASPGRLRKQGIKQRTNRAMR